MKVLLINNYHYRRGGADVVYLNTYELLKEKGHDVFCFSSKNDKNDINGINPYFINEVKFLKVSLLQKAMNFLRFFYSFSSRKMLRKILNNKNFDVAHVHTYKGMFTSSILRELKKQNIPIIFTAHDYGLMDPHNALLDGNFEISENTIKKSAFYTVIDKANRNSYLYSFISYLEYSFGNLLFDYDKNFNKVICVSKFAFLKHQQSKRFDFKLAHLYNFFPKLFSIEPSKNRGKYFLFFGRLSKEKGFSTLIEAWKNANINQELWIVGSTEASLNNELKVENTENIRFLGYKKGEELFSIISNSSFVIVPSEWYENNPLTIIESYSYGKPVIGSKVGGIPELIMDNETGYKFEMKNTQQLTDLIIKASSISNEEYEQMSKNARSFAQDNFSPEKHYKKLIGIYKEVLKC